MNLVNLLRKYAEIDDSLLSTVVDLPSNVADWPEEYKEIYDERAAIMEFDGEIDRQEAEIQAEAQVRAIHYLHISEGKGQ